MSFLSVAKLLSKRNQIKDVTYRKQSYTKLWLNLNFSLPSHLPGQCFSHASFRFFRKRVVIGPSKHLTRLRWMWFIFEHSVWTFTDQCSAIWGVIEQTKSIPTYCALQGGCCWVHSEIRNKYPWNRTCRDEIYSVALKHSGHNRKCAWYPIFWIRFSPTPFKPKWYVAELQCSFLDDWKSSKTDMYKR